MAEAGAYLAYVAFGDELADSAGGDGVFADVARGVDADSESELAAEGFKVVDVAFDAVTALDFNSFELVVKDVKGLARGYVQWLPRLRRRSSRR